MIKRKHSGSDLTIFSEMTVLALKHNAVNLSQGFPDYAINERLKKLLFEATVKNFNQYAPTTGSPLLIENLMTFNSNRKNPISLTKDTITISPGASYGIYTALAAILKFGEEVIVLEPCMILMFPPLKLMGEFLFLWL